MRFTFEENNDYIVFKVNDFKSKYESVLENSYYTLNNDTYIKKYDKSWINTTNIDSIKANYLNNAEEMFMQMNYEKPTPWEDVLMSFIRKVRGKDIDWWLTGSCALCVRGINVNPHDIDIMLHGKDINKIMEIFEDDMIEPLCNSEGWVTKHFAVLFLKARIDLAFDPQECLDISEPSDSGPFAMENLKKVYWRGETISVPPLYLQLNNNKSRGRLDRVKSIENFLNI